MATVGQLLINLEARSDKLEKELAKARRDLQRTERSMRGIGASSQRTERVVTGAFSRMSVGAGGLTTRLVATSRAMQGVLVAGAAALASGFIARTIAATDAIGKMSDRLGVSTGFLQEMRFVTSQTGVTMEQFQMALQRLTRRSGDAIRGSAEVTKAFQQIGISVADLQRISPQQLFLRFADAIQSIQDPALRLSTTVKFLDQEAAGMVNTFRLGSEGIEALSQKARDLGLVLDDSMVRNAEAANDQLDIMQRVLSIQMTRAIVSLAPTITALGHSFARVVSALNKGQDAIDKLTPSERAFADALREVARVGAEVWGVITDITSAYHDLRVSVDKLAESPLFKTLKDITDNPIIQRFLLGNKEALSTGPGRGFGLLRERTPVELAEREVEQIQHRINLLRENLQRSIAAGRPMSAIESSLLKKFSEDLEAAKLRVEELKKSASELAKPVISKQEPAKIPEVTVTAGAGITGEDMRANLRLDQLQKEAQEVAGTFHTWLPAILSIEQEIRNSGRAVIALNNEADRTPKTFKDAAEQIEKLVRTLDESEAATVQLSTEYESLIEKPPTTFMDAAEQIERMVRSMDDFGQKMLDAEATAKELRDRLIEQGKAITQEHETPLEGFRRQQANLNELFASGAIQVETYERAMNKLSREYAATTTLGEALTTGVESTMHAIETSIDGVIQGTQSLADAFKNMVKSILATLATAALRKGVSMLLSYAIGALAGAGAGAGGGGSGGGIGSTAGGGGQFPMLTAQHGGKVPGPTGSAPDSVVARLTPGEFVMRPEAVRKIGIPTLELLNRSGLELPVMPKFQEGGTVEPAQAQYTIGVSGSPITSPARMNREVKQQRQEPAPVEVNVILVDTRTKAEELAAGLPNAIIRTVTDQITGGNGTPINRALKMVHGR